MELERASERATVSTSSIASPRDGFRFPTWKVGKSPPSAIRPSVASVRNAPSQQHKSHCRHMPVRESLKRVLCHLHEISCVMQIIAAYSPNHHFHFPKSSATIPSKPNMLIPSHPMLIPFLMSCLSALCRLVDRYWARNECLQNVISTTQAGPGRLV